MEIYVDGYIVLNFLMDYLLLWAAAAWTGVERRGWRLILGAAVGGAYGGLSLAPGFQFLGNAMWQAVFFLLMAFSAFGWGRQLFRQCILMMMLSMALGGSAYLLRQNGRLGFFALACVGTLLAIGCRMAARGGFTPAGDLVKVDIRLGARETTVIALRDTGNSLRDPITGQPVLVAQWETAQRILPIPLSQEELERPAETMVALQGRAPNLRFRLIPYKAVGTGSGMLLAVRCDKVEAGGHFLGNLVAFSPNTFSENGTYQALTGGIA